MFVVRCAHDEHRFDVTPVGAGARAVSHPAVHRVAWTQARGTHGRAGRGRATRGDPHGARSMTALVGARRPASDRCPRLARARPVGGAGRRYPRSRDRRSPARCPTAPPVPTPGPRSTVRRRRTLLAVMALLLVALALPLSGTGGHSHATGSALAETQGPVDLHGAARRHPVDHRRAAGPTADPRPLVARLAAQTGSDTVVPGRADRRFPDRRAGPSATRLRGPRRRPCRRGAGH